MNDAPKKPSPEAVAAALASVRADLKAYEEIHGPALDSDVDETWPEDEPPEWKDEAPKRVESADQLMRRWEREQYEKFHPPKTNPKPPPHANGEDKAPVEPLITVRASSWHGLEVPETTFLDERKLIPMESSSFFVGQTKIGKTYVALSASIACVSGTLWMNEPIRQGPVLFYSAEENMKVLHQRVAKICVAENMHLDVLDNLHFADLSALIDASLIQGKNNTGTVTPTELYERLDITIGRLKPVCVWLDNRGLVVTGNENDRGIAANAMRAFQLLATKHKCAIIMIAHPSKGGESDNSGSSGSTAWFATGRSVIYMEKPKEAAEGVRVITNTMSNYGPGGIAINVKWEFDRYRCTDQPRRAGDEIGQAEKHEKVFMKLLRLLTEQGMGDDLSPLSRATASYAPTVFAAHKDCEKVTPGQFKKAMQSLFARKVIEIAERGPRSRRVKYIREVRT